MILRHALNTLLAFWILPACLVSAETGLLFRAEEKGKWGFINKEGKFVIKPQFDDSYYSFSEGLAAVKTGRKWGYIDDTGKTVIPFSFEGAQKFKDGIAAVHVGDFTESGGKWGYIDRAAGYIFESKEHLTYTGFQDGLMPVKKEEKWGYINTKGEWAITPKFEDAEDFSDGLAGVRLDDETTGYIDTTGELVIRLKGAHPHYEGFSEGLAPVFVDGEKKYGFINRRGEFVIPPQYAEARSFSEGRAEVCILGKDESGWPERRWGAIDREGKLIVPAIYKAISSYHEGMARVTNKEGHGFVNLSGEVSIPCKFRNADSFENGLAYVTVGDWKTEWSGYIDKSGKFVWRPSDFSEKDKARQKVALQEKNRVPSIKLLTDSKSKEKGLLLTYPKQIPFQGPGAGEVPISVVNLLDEEVFIEVTGNESLGCSLEFWNGGFSGGGGGGTFFPDNTNLLKRLHATHYGDVQTLGPLRSQRKDREDANQCFHRFGGSLGSKLKKIPKWNTRPKLPPASGSKPRPDTVLATHVPAPYFSPLVEPAAIVMNRSKDSLRAKSERLRLIWEAAATRNATKQGAGCSMAQREASEAPKGVA